MNIKANVLLAVSVSACLHSASDLFENNQSIERFIAILYQSLKALIS